MRRYVDELSDDLGLSPEFLDPANIDSEEDFRPIGECVACDEPFEQGYNCADCGRPVCPCCVSAPLGVSVKERPLCPECPGACCEYFPEVF